MQADDPSDILDAGSFGDYSQAEVIRDVKDVKEYLKVPAREEEEETEEERIEREILEMEAAEHEYEEREREFQDKRRKEKEEAAWKEAEILGEQTEEKRLKREILEIEAAQREEEERERVYQNKRKKEKEEAARNETRVAAALDEEMRRQERAAEELEEVREREREERARLGLNRSSKEFFDELRGRLDRTYPNATSSADAWIPRSIEREIWPTWAQVVAASGSQNRSKVRHLETSEHWNVSERQSHDSTSSSRSESVFDMNEGQTTGLPDTNPSTFGPSTQHSKERSMEEHDRMTVVTGSIAGTMFLEEPLKQDLASAFVKEIISQLALPYHQRGIDQTRVEEDVEALLRDFAILMGLQARTSRQIDSVRFVRQQRRLIAKVFGEKLQEKIEGMTEADEIMPRPTIPVEEITSESKINSWFDELGQHDGQISDGRLHLGQPTQTDYMEASEPPLTNAIPASEPGDTYRPSDVSAFASDDEEDFNFRQLTGDITEFRNFLVNSDEWRWLVSKLAVSQSCSGGIRAIADSIIGALTRRPVGQDDDAGTWNAMFKVAWNPLEFLLKQYAGGHEVRLEQIITVTDSGRHLQACTCGEYVKQLWPFCGSLLLQALQAAVNVRFLGSVIYDVGPKTSVAFKLDGNQLLVSAFAPASKLIDIGEQLAWLGAACEASPYSNEKCHRAVRITTRESQMLHIDIDYDVKMLSPPDEQSCWRSLFGCISIALGFPVPARQNNEPGMELSTDLILTLGEIEWATVYNNRFLLKGFSSMCVPMLRTESAVTWHFTCTDNWTYLPFGASTDSCIEGNTVTSIQMSCLYQCRQFVGWCKDAEVDAGTMRAPYEHIREPGSTAVASNLVLEKASISAGKFLTVGATIARGRHHQGLWTCGDTTYRRMIRKARQMHVILYDTAEHCAWLVDGTSALLHLSLTQVRSSDIAETLNKKTISSIKYAGRGHGGRAAEWALLDLSNRNIILEENEETWTEIEIDKSGNRIEQEKAFKHCWRFEHLVRENWEILAKIWEHQLTPPSGLEVRFTDRDRLEGWSFKSIVDQVPLLKPKLVYLKASGRGWVDFARSIDAITLLGRGFGDIIRPARDFQGCRNWLSLPRQLDFLATPLEVLRRICDRYGDLDDFPEKITSGIRWHQPDKLFEQCGCHKQYSIRPSCDRVQVLLPPSLGKHTRPKLDSFCERGAVVFGRSEKYKWFWPLKGDPTPLPEENADLDLMILDESHGLGQAITSQEGLVRQPGLDSSKGPAGLPMWRSNSSTSGNVSSARLTSSTDRNPSSQPSTQASSLSQEIIPDSLMTQVSQAGDTPGHRPLYSTVAKSLVSSRSPNNQANRTHSKTLRRKPHFTVSPPVSF